jgi:hypothetical protein
MMPLGLWRQCCALECIGPELPVSGCTRLVHRTTTQSQDLCGASVLEYTFVVVTETVYLLWRIQSTVCL